MKEMIKIVVLLSVSCLLAGIILSGVFAITEKAKKHNELMEVKHTMLNLLGYNKAHPAPSDLKLHTIYRYIIEEEKGKIDLGYMLPVEKAGRQQYELVIINLQGQFVTRFALHISSEKVTDPSERKAALVSVLRPRAGITYADRTITATLGHELLAYLIPGQFTGFKSVIKVMLALDPTYNIIGLDITQDEEDPGLGGNINKKYFKNQFIDKSYKILEKLKVVKKPLPTIYRNYLETEPWRSSLITKKTVEDIRKKYEAHNIYALTGATISSRAVTNGVKGIVKKFVYRVKILDNVIVKQKIAAAF